MSTASMPVTCSSPRSSTGMSSPATGGIQPPRWCCSATSHRGFPTRDPNFLFLDRVEDIFYLGIASDHWGWGQLLGARERDLFPTCAQGSLDLAAFTPVGMFPFPV